MNFFKKHSFIYKIILAVTLVVLVVIYMEPDYKIANWISSNFPNFGNSNSTDTEYELITYPHRSIPSYDADNNTMLQTDTNYNSTLYEAEFMELATGTHMVPRLVTTSGNCLYYVTMEGENSENSDSYTIWCENFENGHTTEKIMQLPTNNQITQIAVDKKHNIYLFTKTRANINEGEISRYYITKYKKTGDVVLYKEITEDIVCDEQPVQGIERDHKIRVDSFFYASKSYYSPYDIAGAGIDDNGIIYAANKKGVVAFSSKGKKIFWIDEPNCITGFVNSRNGSTYAAYAPFSNSMDYNFNTIAKYVRSINLFGKLSNTAYDFPTNFDIDMCGDDVLVFASASICSSGMNYDMLTKSNFGLYGCNFKKRTANEILLWANIGIDGRNVDFFAELADGRFLAISHHFDDRPVEVAVISPMKSDTKNEPKVITLGVCWIDEYTKNAVIEYNRNQNDHIIQLVLADNVAEASQCDIFAIDGNSPMAEQYVAEGKIEDLTPYFDASIKVSTDDFMPAVVEAHTYDGLLIGIPSTVYLYAVDKEATGGTADWTLEDMQNIINDNPDLKNKLDNYTIAYTLAYYNCQDFVNLEEVVSSYVDPFSGDGYYFMPNGTGFYEIIDYADTFPKIESDTTLLDGLMNPGNNHQYINNVSDISELKDADNCTGILRDNGATYCISALSANKSESWQFLESLLSTSSDSSFRFGTETDVSALDDGIPTRKDILERKILSYSENNDNTNAEQFLRIASESSYMKYNISAIIMVSINLFLDETIETYSKSKDIYLLMNRLTGNIKHNLNYYINNYY